MDQEKLKFIPEQIRSVEGQETPLEILAEVILRPSKYAIGLPRGRPGDIRKGFSFYERNKDGTESLITSDITDSPVLEAVTKEQFQSWKKKKIVARPRNFVWSGEKRIWVVGSISNR